jgi:hypothetical protein
MTRHSSWVCSHYESFAIYQQYVSRCRARELSPALTRAFTHCRTHCQALTTGLTIASCCTHYRTSHRHAHTHGLDMLHDLRAPASNRVEARSVIKQERMEWNLSSTALPAVQNCLGGDRHAVALLRMINPVNRGPQRATARRQCIGSWLPNGAKAPTQQDGRPSPQVHEEIRLTGSLQMLVGKGSSSPDHI